MSWRSLAEKFRQYHVPTPARPRLKRMLWSKAWEQRQRTQDDVRKLAAKGQRLEGLLHHPGWQDLLELKAYCQSSWDATTKLLEVEDQVRFQAACQWATLEHFLSEVDRVVKLGQQAQEKVRQLTAKE